MISLPVLGADLDIKIPKSQCEDVDIRDKMSPAMRKHFSVPRDQGSVGWCYGFVAADLVSAEVGQPVSSIHTSALYNQALYKEALENKENQKSFFRSLFNIFERTRMSSDDPSFSTIVEGGFSDLAIQDLVKAGGVCLEKDIPFGGGFISFGETLKASLEMIDYFLEMGLSKTACYRAEVLSSAMLPDVDFENIVFFLQNENINIALNEIVKEHCADNQVKVPDLDVAFMINSKEVRRKHSGESYASAFERAAQKTRKFFSVIDKKLRSGKPVGVSYDLDQIMNHKGAHASLISGRRWSDGQCHFKIRNSWGKTCSDYDKSKISSCDEEEGSYWVSANKLYEMTKTLTYISE